MILKPALALLAAISCLVAMPSGVNADTPISAMKAPGAVVPAGKRVVYYDRTRLMVLDPLSSSAPRWLVVQLPDGASYDGRLTCSADGKGSCAVGLRKGHQTFLGVFQADGSGRLVDTPIEFDRILAVASDERIYVSRKQDDSTQQVLQVDARTRQHTVIGTLRAGEKFKLLPLDGALQPVFVVNANEVRFPGEPKAVALAGGISSERSANAQYQFGANDLFQKYPDGLDRTVIWRRTYRRRERQLIGGPFDRVDFPLPAPSLMLSEGFASDQSGHVLGLKTSGHDLSLVALCTSKDGKGGGDRGAKDLLTFPVLTEVRVIGDSLGDGFVVRVRRPGENEVFDYVSFAQSASDRLGGSACSDLDARIVENLPIPGSAFPSGWVEKVQSFTTSDGTKIQGVLFRQAAAPITTLIVDVYGASGLLRTTIGTPNDFLQSDEMKGVAIFYPVLPGDGNLGWHFAAVARSPNRTETVHMLADVAVQAKNRLLAKGGKLILRGGSAGGWLAVKTALSQPNLADEVVSISGAYFFEPDDAGILLADFFRVSDSITGQDVAGCGNTFFRLIHGTEDRIVPVERVRRFAAMMSAHNCKGALHMVVGGDHNLIDFSDLRTNAETNKILHWEYGLEP